MKTIAFTILSLILGATVFAEPLQVEIAARYEGFDRARYAEIAGSNKEHKPDDVLSAPRITAKSGQRAVIEIVREVQVPEAPDGEKTVNSGVSLEVLPVIKDGQITLSGKSVLRRRLAQDAAQPLGALSFATHEMFFGGAVQNGKELTIAVGDGPNDKARIILTVRLVDPAAGKPQYRVYALDASFPAILRALAEAHDQSETPNKPTTVTDYLGIALKPSPAALLTPADLVALLQRLPAHATKDVPAASNPIEIADVVTEVRGDRVAVDFEVRVRQIDKSISTLRVTLDSQQSVIVAVPDGKQPAGQQLFLICPK